MKQTFWILLFTVTTVATSQDIYNKAKNALMARDTSGAVVAFSDALKAGQKPAESNYYLGAIAFARNSMADAVRFMEASLQTDDDNLDAYKVLGAAYLKNNEATKGLDTYRRAAKLAPKDCDVAVAYGRALLAADSVDAAVVNLTKAKDCSPNDPSIFEGLGDVYLKQGVTPLAITNYQQSVTLAPQNIEVNYKLARAFEKNKQYSDAVKTYKDVIALDSTNADPYFQMGSILIRAKQYGRSVEPLRKFVELRPKSFEGNSMLAKALLETKKNNEDVVKYAKIAIDIDSSSADVWRNYFYGLVEIKDFGRAEEALAGLQRRGKLEVGDYLKLGDLYFGLKKRDEALKWYNEAVSADSTNCDPFFNLGFLYMQGQQYADAAMNFEKKIACDSNSMSAYVNAAASHMQTKNFDRARALLVNAIERKPDFFQGRLWLARYYVQVDSFDNAKTQYEEVLRLVGDNTEKYKKEAGEAHSLLASLYSSRQQYGKAIEQFQEASKVGFENGAMHLSWGQAILQTLSKDDQPADSKRKNDEAVRHFRRCIEMEPNNAQGHLWLAEGLMRSRVPGDNAGIKQLTEEACSEYRKALKLDPKNDDAKKGIERAGC